MISASMVKELRNSTGAGMMDCKKALVEADGDMAKAIDILREKGLSQAAKKASRIAAEGAVVSYISENGKIGVITEVNCETDFVGHNENFQALAKSIAAQIASVNPADVAVLLEHEKEVLREQARNEGKPENVVEKMVTGRVNKYYKEVCLVDQPFIKDGDLSVAKLLQSKSAEVIRFSRFQLGEGIEKKQDNLAEEVAKQINQ